MWVSPSPRQIPLICQFTQFIQKGREASIIASVIFFSVSTSARASNSRKLLIRLFDAVKANRPRSRVSDLLKPLQKVVSSLKSWVYAMRETYIKQ